MSKVKHAVVAFILLFVANLGYSENPIFSGLYADPEVLIVGDTYYIYPTTDGSIGWMSDRYRVFSSTDLIHWQDDGEILNFANVSWATDNAWAPSIAQKDGVFYFYFCADQQIGVAKSSSPIGPFVDAIGGPLVTVGEYGGQSIDPDVFIDDDGQAYLYFGQGALHVAKLNADMISFNTPPQNITPSGFNEGAEVFKRNGIYYLLWSENDTRSEDYRIGYATADNPLGPFTNQNTIILMKNSSLGILGTGHNSVLKDINNDDYYMVYHRFAIPGGDGYHREVAIDRLHFSADGAIQPVVVTLSSIDAENQIFPDSYRITNRNSGKVLTISGTNKFAEDALIQQYPDENSEFQKWNIIRKDNGYYNIVSTLSGHFFDIRGTSSQNGAENVQNAESGGTSQDWRIIPLGNGYYSIVNRNSGKLLDISGASTLDGAQNIQWPTNGGLNQQWLISP